MNVKLIYIRDQRNERLKWVHSLVYSITLILFCASLDEYDLTLSEDDPTNRMMDALTFFEEICQNTLFKSTPVVLFLNKRDLFEEKIKWVDLKCCFDNYEGMFHARFLC